MSLKQLATAVVLTATIFTPASAQQAMSEPAYRAQF
jgi:hypothetical protein